MTDKVQKIKEWISKEQDGLIDTNGNFEYPEHEGAYHILCNLDAYIDSLQEAPVSEELEKAAEKAAVETFFVSPQWTEIRKEQFKAGANWQKEQDQSIIELAEDHAMLAGMEKMKEQMIKDAVDAKVIPADLDVTQFCLSDYDEVSYITAMVKAGKLKLLDKVKLVIVKED